MFPAACSGRRPGHTGGPGSGLSCMPERSVFMRNRKGFTLVEMIVTMALITIVASAAYPRIAGYIRANKETYRANQEYLVNKALIQYYALTGAYYKPADDYLTWDEITDADAMIAELNNRTGALISSHSDEYKYIKAEGSDISGKVDIRKIKVELK